VLGTLFTPTGILATATILIILIFVHEFGHFITAKRLGIPVLEFGFGFPPRAWRFAKSAGMIELQGRRLIIPASFQLPEKLQVGSRVTYKTTRDEKGREILTGIDLVDEESQGLVLASPVQYLDPGTEYTLNWIPLGGFVRLAGEEDPSTPGGFQSAKPWVRIVVLLAGVTMNFILAYLVFSIMAVSTPPFAGIQTTRVATVEADSPAASGGLKPGDIIVAVNGTNVRDDFDTLTQILKDNEGRAVTLTLQRSGKILDPVSVVLRANVSPNQGRLGIVRDGYVGVRVTSVEPGSIAANAGVRAGDVVAFLVDPKVPRGATQSEFAQYTQAHPGFKIELHVAREGKLIANDPVVVQIPDAVTEQNATLGMQMQTPWIQAPFEGANTMVRIFASIPIMFQQIARAGLPDNSFVGIVGIVQATGEIAQRGGFMDLVGWLGLLSLNLAIVNLFPFPPLDGGQLVFVFLEWVRGGKRIDLKMQRRISEIGILILLGLMVVITFSDFQRGFAGRPILPP
jgi:regulator of sigma E protease